MKGRRFESLAAQNMYLAEWERNVADTRIHGTIHQQVGPSSSRRSRQPCCRCRRASSRASPRANASVHRYGDVEFDKAFYSVPPEYLAARCGCAANRG